MDEFEQKFSKNGLFIAMMRVFGLDYCYETFQILVFLCGFIVEMFLCA